MPDAHKNFAYSTIATAPSPADTGTSLVVQTGDAAKFPTPPFNATIWPYGDQPLTTNAEIVRVTAISGDTMTITRTQEGSTARLILVGDQIAATITAKTLTDAEQSGVPAGAIITVKKVGSGAGDLATRSLTYVRVDPVNLSYAVVVPVGSRLVVVAKASVWDSSVTGQEVDLAVADGTADNVGIIDQSSCSSAGSGGFGSSTATCLAEINGDGATHTINLQWRSGVTGGFASMKNSGGFVPVMVIMLLPG
jgi:hypothetical protein